MDLDGLHVDELHPFFGDFSRWSYKLQMLWGGLLEIKCSYMFQNKIPKDACTDHHYHQKNCVRFK